MVNVGCIKCWSDSLPTSFGCSDVNIFIIELIDVTSGTDTVHQKVEIFAYTKSNTNNIIIRNNNESITDLLTSPLVDVRSFE